MLEYKSVRSVELLRKRLAADNDPLGTGCRSIPRLTPLGNGSRRLKRRQSLISNVDEVMSHQPAFGCLDAHHLCSPFSCRAQPLIGCFGLTHLEILFPAKGCKRLQPFSGQTSIGENFARLKRIFEFARAFPRCSTAGRSRLSGNYSRRPDSISLGRIINRLLPPGHYVIS